MKVGDRTYMFVLVLPKLFGSPGDHCTQVLPSPHTHEFPVVPIRFSPVRKLLSAWASVKRKNIFNRIQSKLSLSKVLDREVLV